MRVLVVEDYEPIRSSVSQALREDGFAVDAAENGKDGLWLAKSGEHDAIILDIMLPEVGGLEILKQLRMQQSDVPVLLLTARDTVDDRVRGLNDGADDYLVKPFAIAELLARVHSLVRRKYGDHSSVIRVGELRIDTSAKQVRVDETEIELTAREFNLLELLMRRRGHVVSRTEVWNALYALDSESTSNVVDVYIGYLRKKPDIPGSPSIIQTRRGHGYLIEVPKV